ncbi:MAG: fibronectin type III domain-containing protein [bacterium]
MKPRKAQFRDERKRAMVRPSVFAYFSVRKILQKVKNWASESYFVRLFRTYRLSPVMFGKSRSHRQFKPQKVRISIMKRIRLFYFELLYLPHLFARKPHDTAYKNIKIYKKYMDHPASGPINRSVVAGFLASTLIFLTLQYVMPNVFNLFTPNRVEASSTPITWTSNADFNTNAVTTGTATTISSTNATPNIIVSNNQMKLNTGAGVPIVQTSTFTVPALVTSISVNISGGGGGGGGGGYSSRLRQYSGTAGTAGTFSSINVGGMTFTANGGSGGGGGSPNTTTPGANGASGSTPFSGYPSLSGIPGGGAVGGAGGSAYAAMYIASAGGSGGAGGVITGTISVTPGQVVTLVTGIAGQGGTSQSYSGSGSSGGAGLSQVTYILPYRPSGNISGLKVDAGNGVNYNWESINWKSQSLPADTSISFQVRTSDNNANWSAWGGPFTQTVAGSISGTGSISSMAMSRYLEIYIILNSPLQYSTPILDEFTINHNSVEAPLNNATTLSRINNVRLKKSTGGELPAGSPGGTTSETGIKVTTTGLSCVGCAVSYNPFVEVEYKPVGTAFDGATNLFTGTADGTNTSVATISGLPTSTSYHLQMRARDAQGRASNWVPYGTAPENINEADFIIDHVSPIGSITGWKSKTNVANVLYGDKYYASSRDIKIAFTATDAGGSNLSHVQFSNDGNSWGSVALANGVDGLPNTIDDVYTFVSDGTSPITGAYYAGDIPWQLTANDGQKLVYYRVVDNANNQTPSYVWSVQQDFNGITQGTLATLNNIDLVTNPDSIGISTLSTPIVQTYSTPGDYSFAVPADVVTMSVEVIGAGGGGDTPTTGGAGGPSTLSINGNPSYYVTSNGGAGGGVVGGTSVGGFAGLTAIDGQGGAGGATGTESTFVPAGPDYDDCDPPNIIGWHDAHWDTVYYSNGGAGGKVTGNITPVTVAGQTLSINVGAGGVGATDSAPDSTNAGNGDNGSIKITYTTPSAFLKGTIGNTGVGLRVGDETNGVKQTWSSMNWSATGLSALNKIGVKVRASDVYGSGSYVNPSNNTNSFYYLSSGTSGVIPISASISKTKTIEVQLELNGDGLTSPILNDLSISALQDPSAITLESIAPTGTVVVKDATTSSTTYAKSKAVKLIMTSSDAGSGVKDFQVSNDGTNWGTYTDASGVILDTVGNCTTPKSWDETTLTCFKPWDSSYSSTGYTAWSLGGSDGPKTIYVRYRDNAGNISGASGLYTTPNTYSYTVPAGITSLYVDIMGGGGGGSAPYFTSGFGGGPSSITVGASTYTAAGGCGGSGEFGPGTCSSLPTNNIGLTVVTGGGGVGGAPECSDGCGEPGAPGDRVYGNINVTPGQVITLIVGAGGLPGGGYDGEPLPGSAGSISYNVGAKADIVLDTAGPTGGTITSPDGFITATSNALVVNDGTDTASGVDTATRKVQRKSATLSAGVCGSYGSFADITTTGTYPNFVDGTIASDNCYQYQYLVSDKAGHQTIYTSTGIAKVDNAGPAGGSISYNSGYFTATSIALTASDGTDTASGVNIASRIMQRKSATLSAGTCGAYGSFATITPTGSYPNFTDTTVVNANCYQYQYLVSDNSANRKTYTTTNVARVDTVAPTTTGSITAGTTGANDWYKEDNVTYTLIPADVTSTVATTMYCLDTIGNCSPTTVLTTPFHITLSTESATNHIRYKSTDNAGNVQTVVDSGVIKLDKTGPNGSVTVNSGDKATNDPELKANLAFTLNDSLSGVEKYQIDNNDNAWLPSTPVDISTSGASMSGTYPNWQLAPAGDGRKVVRIKLTDLAGNEVTNITNWIAYDTTPPSSVNTIVVKNGDNLSQTLEANGHSQGWYTYNKPQFNFGAVDDESGIKEFKYCFYRAADENCDYSVNTPIPAIEEGETSTYKANYMPTLTDLRQGALTFKVKGVDYVGLESPVATYIYKYDVTLPGRVSGFSASKGTEETTVKLTWNVANIDTGYQAPIEQYKIERLLASEYTSGLGVDGNWAETINGTKMYPSYYSIVLDTVTDSAKIPKIDNIYNYRDETMENSTKYIYRISAKDFSNTTPNDGFGPPPVNEPAFETYGYTKDSKTPEIMPSGVTADVCDGASLYNIVSSPTGNCTDLSKRAKEVKVSWSGASDKGSGIDYYEIYRREGYSSMDLTGWTVVGTSPETNDSLIVRRVFFDETVLDAKKYSYRIVAYDNARPIPANSTDLILNNDETDVTNATIIPAEVPDITAPIVPDAFGILPLGIDYNNPAKDANGDPFQKVMISWKQTTDNYANTSITYDLYFKNVASEEPFEQIHTESSEPYDPAVIPPATEPPTKLSFSYSQTGLEGLTSYYYQLKVTDSDGNTATSSTKVITTGNSAAPTPPTEVEVRNDVNSLTNASTQLAVSYRGSWSRKCNSVTKANCIIGYEAYQTTSNISPDIDGSQTVTDSDNCSLTETPDDCWIRINSATLVNNQTLNPIEDERYTSKRSFVANNLISATRYYYRVRAIDNSTDVVGGLKSAFSTTFEETKHKTNDLPDSGWDITRDLTPPPLPIDGLEVKVRDTHPNSTLLRNLISWKILSEKPLRKKLPYETAYNATTNPKGCKIVVVSGVDYCNDFYSYEVYREVVDSNDKVIYETSTPIKTEINPETNFYIDEIGNTDLIGGTGNSSLLIDAKIRYYVKVVDSSTHNFNYPDGSSINALPNKTERQNSAYTIIPAKAIPAVIGSVSLTDVSVTTAVVGWATDQDTDSLVQYRVKGSTGDWVTVGQVERSSSHSVRLIGMLPNTAYEYKLVSRNYLDNRALYVESSVPDLATTGFNITPGTVTTTTSTTEVKWTTNLDASSAFVEYQLQKQPGDDPQGGTAGVEPAALAASPANHKVIIKGLRSSRTYTYKIKSISKDGYLAEHPAGEFATFKTRSFDSAQFTLSPSSSNVAERNITATTAQIVWQTENPTTSWVDYSTTSGVYDGAAGNNDLVSSHVVVIDGLIPGTKYFYRVRVKDVNEVEYTSQEYSFTAILKPKIANMSVRDITPYSVTISWETNVDTETILNWGTTAAYGEKRGITGESKAHQIKVDNLLDNQEYHYQIVAKDETGNEVVDIDKIVRTPLDTDGPKITNAKVDILPMGESDSTSSIIVSWQTNKPASTQVKYGEGMLGGEYANESVEDPSLNNSHTVIIKGLRPASTYHYKMISKDKRANVTESQDYTFVTPTKEKSILQLILKSLEDTFAWTGKLNQFFGKLGNRFMGR